MLGPESHHWAPAQAPEKQPPYLPRVALAFEDRGEPKNRKNGHMKKHLGSAKAVAHVHSVMSMPVFEHDKKHTHTQKKDDKKQEKNLELQTKRSSRAKETSCKAITRKERAKT